MLLGADVYAAILEPGVIKGGQREPVAQRTSLGWIVSGAVGTLTSHNATSALQCHVDEPLSTLVRRFWEQEEVRPEPTPMTSDERECEDLFVRTVARNSDGRYVVRLPLSSPLPDLAGSRLPATRMLLHMEKRFEHVADLKTLYHDFMHQYEAMNHMTRAEPLDHSRKQVCYLPHHGVMKDTSTSTKLRVVFNGSLSSPSGDSLNKHLMTGPNLLPPLADILLRWRWHRYVFSADVEKMYRQILVHPDDRDLQRIVWREDRAKPIEEYQLNTVTYGLACAPFLAIRTLRQLADDEESEFPLGAPILRRDVYMDDVLSGAATSAEARDALCQLSGMCMAGGFPLKKWAANEPSLLNGIPDEDRSRPDTCAWLSHHNHSALGLQWNSGLDSLSFTIRPVKEERITKRSVLSQAARLFDPLGWLAPVVVRAKIIIQSTWLQGLDWDTPLPDADAARWRQLQSELPLLADIRVPRWLHSSPSDEAIEVHGFADASERAYAAAVYLRTVTKESVNVTLMMAKTKVAPIKQVSLPRLELCAAALLTKLIAHILTVLNLKVQPVHLWSDSTVTLGWIHGHPSRWVTYVANRVSEIQTLLPRARWHHVSGADNPADCASRGLSPGELGSHPLWWQGPTWLRERDDFWDSRPAVMEDEAALPEQRTQVHTGATQPASEETSMLARYASLSRLLRITAWCRRWLRVRDDKLGSSSLSGELSSDEIDRSLCGWVRMVQSVHFKDELEDCKKGKTVSRRSILTKLSPFIDDQGILRVGGRIKHSLLAYDERHPMILSTTTPLTALMIGSCHARTLHGGVQQTLGLLRQRFWIPRGRAVVKSHLHRCLQCLRWRAATPRQTMADLPRSRVTPSRPFLHTGVDYAGPILLRATKGRGHKTGKAFIAVFICFSTRAIHIEVVSDYTAAAFLAALRRFTARRGLCQVLYSDCGTTFTGADAELRALFTASNKEARRIQHALADEHIQWRFNPPAAPHFGGLWEAAVKSIKHHLRRVVGDSTLTYEEMSTLLAQVEACLNSRPLQALTDDPEDMAALTPGHFLVGAPLTAIPEPSLLDTPINRLSRWQHVQRMRDHFWDRWSQEYIHGLIPRQKWWKDNAALKEGQLCLIRNENTPASRWPLARISALHPGKDGRVRVVTLRTATSELTRPINKIVLLPVHSATEVEKQ